MQQPYAQPQQQPAPPPSAAQAPAGADSGGDPISALKKLKEMLELGLIEQAEFDSKKAEIMSRL
jgi:hypothetical protein